MFFRETIEGSRARHTEQINMFLRKTQNFVLLNMVVCYS